MSDQKYISELHNDHKVWLSELTLSQDQIKSFSTRLGEVATANTATDVLAQVEHFQNSFIRHNEVIDGLFHDIRKSESELAATVSANNVATEHKKVADDEALRDRMVSFQKIFGELKTEFTGFLAKTL